MLVAYAISTKEKGFSQRQFRPWLSLILKKKIPPLSVLKT